MNQNIAELVEGLGHGAGIIPTRVLTVAVFIWLLPEMSELNIRFRLESN